MSTQPNETFHMLVARENELLEQMHGLEKKVEAMRQQWCELRQRKAELYRQQQLQTVEGVRL